MSCMVNSSRPSMKFNRRVTLRTYFLRKSCLPWQIR
jgi:hypothetical protein